MKVAFAPPQIPQLRQQGMLVDMHFHSGYSHDSSTSVASIIEKCQALGVHVALTDHNTIRGVRAAEQLAPGVIKPAIEVTTREGKDILLYFAAYQDLEDFHSAIIEPHVRSKSSLRSGRTSLPIKDLLEAARHWECVVALAHPFAIGPRRSYPFFRNGAGRDLLDGIDAIEVVNQAIPHRRNLTAIGWAAQEGKTAIGGSDGHILGMLGSAFTIADASDWRGFLGRVKEGQVMVVGEERKLHHHVANMGRILREKGRVMENRRIRNGK